MIKIYKNNRGYKSTKDAMNWLDNYFLDYEVIKIRDLTLERFIHMLSLSEHGFEDFIIASERGNELKKKFDYETMTTKEMINFLIENQSFLKSPIIYDDRKLLIGWSEDDARVFLPGIRIY